MEGNTTARPKRTGPSIWAIFAGIAGGICIIACLLVAIFYTALTKGGPAMAGSPAPDFELTTTTGQTVRLSGYRGRPLLLGFGATWCPGCQQELTTLRSIQADHPELAVLLVDSDEDLGTLLSYYGPYNLNFPVAVDNTGSVAAVYRVYSIPVSFFIDAEGIIQKRAPSVLTADQLQEGLEAIGLGAVGLE